MQLLVDFLPVIVFVVAFKLYDMYVATAAIMIVMTLQVAYQWLRTRTVNKMLLVSSLLVLVFGGITLALHDPIFIQWKPTVVNWLFAAAFLLSRYIGKQTLIERIMGHAIVLPQTMWRQLNLMWTGNFLLLGAANIYVVYNFSEETWVNFKLYGMLGLTLLMAVAQAIWIAKNTQDETRSEP